MPPPDTNLTSIIMVISGATPAQESSVESVLAQTAPFELIVVNNAAPPETCKGLKAKAKTDARIRLIESRGDIGKGAGNNLGAREAKGERLLFLSPDIILPPDAIEKLWAEAEKIHNIAVLGVRVVDEKGKERLESRRRLLTPTIGYVQALELSAFLPRYSLSLTHELLPEKTTEIPAISGACMFISTKDFARNKGFDKKCQIDIEDMDFCERLSRLDGRAYFVPHVTAKQTVAAHTATTLLAVEKKSARSIAHYFNENFGHAYPQPILWLLDILILSRLTLRRVVRQFLEKKEKTRH